MRSILARGLTAVVVLASIPASKPARAAEDDLPVASEPPRVVPIVVADSYYAVHDRAPAGRNATLATTAIRHNEIAVNLIAIGAKLEHAKLTGTAVLHAGTAVDALYSGVAASVRSSLEIWKHIQLANVGWKAGDFHLEAGLLPGLIGRESFVSTDNWNYTRAIISDSTPYYVTGARVTWRVAPTFSLMATAFNGWDHHGDRNKQKSGQLRFSWSPSERLSIDNTVLAGAEQVSIAGQKTAYRLFEDLVIAYRLLTRVHLAAEGWIGTERELRVEDPRKGDAVNAHFTKHPTFYGGAIWAKWQFADTTYVALRGETAHDPNGVILGRGARTIQEPAPGQRLYAGTITLGWQPHPRLLARVEAVHRISDEPFFAGGDATTYVVDLPATGPTTFSSESRKSSTTFVVSAAFAY